MSNTIVNNWCHRIEDFTERNRGRLIGLRTIPRDMCTLSEARRVRLSSANYDKRADRLDVVVASGDAHLSHHIGHVTSVYILHAHGLEGDMLAIDHDGGQTVIFAEPPLTSDTIE